MVDNIIIEQLVKHHYTKADNKTRFIILIITALFVLLWLNLNSFAAIAMMVILTIAIAVFFMNFFLNREYEYCFVDGELDIDVIYNKRRRRRVFTGESAEFEVLAHFTDSEHLGFYRRFKLKDFSSGLVTKNTYVFVAAYKGKKFRIAFDPDDRLIDALRRYVPSQKFFMKQTTEEKL